MGTIVKNSRAEDKIFYSAKELYELDVKELPVLVDPLFIKSGLIVFAGSSDTGKSTILRQLGIAIARGDDKFLDWEIKAKHNRVIYVSTEDDSCAISYLLNKTLGEDADTDDLKNLNYIFDTEDLETKLDLMLEENPADCVIIDALTDLYGGDLNQSNRVRTFLNRYFNLANKHQCLFIFLHHTGKWTEEKIPNKNYLLGSQGIEGKARQVIELRRDPENKNYRHLCIVKGNYQPDDMKDKSFKLQFNDNLSFEMTGDRVAFEKLVKKPKASEDKKKIEMKKVFEFYERGMNSEEVAQAMTDEGYPMKKSKANKLYNEAKIDLNDSKFDG